MTTKEINDKLLELFENRPSNCNSVSYSRKEVDGKKTNEWSFVYTVDKKKPLSELTSEDIISKEVNVDGVVIHTDVVEGITKFTAYENCPCEFYEWTSSFCSTSTSPLLNKNNVSPVKGGLQISNTAFNEGLGYTYGTMGFIAVDSDDNSIVGVTNNHVIIGDAFRADQWSASGPFSSTLNQVVAQPYSFSSSNIIGGVKRYTPMLKSGTGINYVDGALLTLDQSVVSNTETYKQFGLDDLSYPLPFATTEEIDDLPNNDWEFFSVGARTGIKGHEATKLKFDGFDTLAVGNNLQGDDNVSATFHECILYHASASTTTSGNLCYDPIYGGDSGSALVARIDGVDKIIGLCFAGRFTSGPGTNGQTYARASKGIANRIDRVAEYLNIEAYTGQTVNFSDRENPEIVYVSGQSNESSITQNGKTYYQGGIIEN